MSCRDREDALFLLAAGELEGDEREALRDHLDAGCPHCGAVYARAEEDLGELLASLPPVDPGPEVRERLLARIRESPARGGERDPEADARPSRRRGGSRGTWRELAAALAGAAAAAAITVAVLGGQEDTRTVPPAGEPAEPREDAAQTPGEDESAALAAEIADLEEFLAEQDVEIQRLEAALADARDALDVLRSPDVVSVELVGTSLQPDARARVFWDWEDYSCYFHAEGLERGERTYALWLTTDEDETLLAGAFSPDDFGEASFFTLLPKDMGKVVRAVVTREPGEPGGQPGGPIQLEQVEPVEQAGEIGRS